MECLQIFPHLRELLWLEPFVFLNKLLDYRPNGLSLVVLGAGPNLLLAVFPTVFDGTLCNFGFLVGGKE